jgi:hypothetical protein
MSVAPDYSRVSIREHTSVRNTDQLYDPLRQTFLNPQSLQRHAALTPVVARSSFLTKDYKLLSPEELQRLVKLSPLRNKTSISPILHSTPPTI